MNGLELISGERWRQIRTVGWTPAHDDGHTGGELAWAAVCYAAPLPVYRETPPDFDDGCPWWVRDPWPWKAEDDGRGVHSRLKQLAIAGALIAAEIDRLMRSAEDVATPYVLNKPENPEAEAQLEAMGVEKRVVGE